MPEVLVFDPSAEASGTELAITLGSHANYSLLEQSYPAPPLQPIMAGSIDTEGERVAGRKHGNREIRHRWDVIAASESALETAVNALAAKVAKLAREGGTFKRTSAAGESRTYDILAADGFDRPLDITYYTGRLATVSYTLTARPYSRGAEVDLGDNTTMTGPALIFTEVANVSGEVAALGRLVIDNDGGTSRRGLLVALRSVTYDASAPLVYEAESIIRYNSTNVVADATAISGSMVRNTSLTTAYQWISGPSFDQPHRGIYRVFVRARSASTNAGAVSIRWRYSASSVVTNASVTLPSGADDGIWFFVDLGEMRVPKVKRGTQAWSGFIEAKSTVAGDDLDLDYILLAPVEEGFARIESKDATFPVLPAGGASSASEFRWDGFAAQVDSLSGRYFDRTVTGDNLYIPPSGAEGRTLQVILKMYATPFGDASTYSTITPAVATDALVGENISARLYVTPRYIT